MYELTVKTNFDAAHRLCGYQGNCANIHGHTWIVEVTVSGEQLNAIGMLIDFKDLKKALKKIIEQLDHQYINDLPQFSPDGEVGNPTAENLSSYIYKSLEGKIKQQYPNVYLSRVKVWESPTSCATYWEES